MKNGKAICPNWNKNCIIYALSLWCC